MATSDPSIRPATASDIPDLIPVMREMEDHYQGENAIADDLIEARLSEWFSSDRDAVLLVAFVDGTLVGHAALAPLFPAGDLSTAWFLKDIYVAEQARGQGIGERLIAACAAETVRRKGSRLDLTVDDGNDGADALYRRLGAIDTHKTYLRWDDDALAKLAEL